MNREEICTRTRCVSAVRHRCSGGSDPIGIGDRVGDVAQCGGVRDRGSSFSVCRTAAGAAGALRWGHSAEVLHVGILNPEQDLRYPPDELGLFLDVLAACVKPPAPGMISVFEARTGEAYSATSREVVPVAPDLRTWDQAQGRYVCLMLTGAGTSRV